MLAQVNGLEVEILKGNTHPALQSTYFRGSEVAPKIIDNNKLQVVDGRGYSASWGSSNVTSTVDALTNDIVRIEVVGWHKHTVSPVGGNYYFVNEGGKWTRRTANYGKVKTALN